MSNNRSILKSYVVVVLESLKILEGEGEENLEKKEDDTPFARWEDTFKYKNNYHEASARSRMLPVQKCSKERKMSKE
jgi:hypothetical protein